MAFIRIKKINTNKYAYLVESMNTKKGPRQKVKQYLGRIYEFEKKEFDISEIKQKSDLNQISNLKDKNEIVFSLIIPELLKRGFCKQKKKYQHQNLIFCPEKNTVTTKNGKEAILALDDGYLCSYTLQKLLNFKKNNDLNSDAVRLAKHFLEAGLSVSEEQFVKFYQLIS